jgi:GNAT superfamily N-acetyltransferase
VSDFFVRAARASDWEAFHAFLIERDHPLDSLEAARQRFERKITSSVHCVLVAELEGRVVGLAMAHEWDEYIMSGRKQIRFSTLEVLPEHRHRGIGSALFHATRDWARGIGATWFEWYASASAIAFYERLGHHGVAHSHPDHPYFEIEFGRD